MKATTKKAAAARKLKAAKICERGLWPGSRLKAEMAKAGIIVINASREPFVPAKAVAANRGRLKGILLEAAARIESGRHPDDHGDHRLPISGGSFY